MSRSFPSERKTAFRLNKMREDKSRKIFTNGVTIHTTIKSPNRFCLASHQPLVKPAGEFVSEMTAVRKEFSNEIPALLSIYILYRAQVRSVINTMKVQQRCQSRNRKKQTNKQCLEKGKGKWLEIQSKSSATVRNEKLITRCPSW